MLRIQNHKKWQPDRRQHIGWHLVDVAAGMVYAIIIIYFGWVDRGWKWVSGGDTRYQGGGNDGFENVATLYHSVMLYITLYGYIPCYIDPLSVLQDTRGVICQHSQLRFIMLCFTYLFSSSLINFRHFVKSCTRHTATTVCNMAWLL